MRRVRPIQMWAAVIVGGRTDWINWTTLARTRAESRKQYCNQWTDPLVGMEHIWRGEVRFQKVLVSPITK